LLNKTSSTCVVPRSHDDSLKAQIMITTPYNKIVTKAVLISPAFASL
jgi:hypothetical protein